jgi:Flp pilus assembly protein TadG
MRAGRRSHRGERERGAAAVEFALLAPVVLLLVFGIISYGYMLSFRQSMSQAATEGARAAAGAPTTALASSAALAAVNDSLGSFGMNCSSSYVTCSISTPTTCTSNTAHKCITVRVSYPYKAHPLIPTVGAGFAMPSTISYTAVTQVN